jgi:hypothetical protein
MSFYSERTIKALRKPRLCGGCLHPMPVGSSALYCSGKHDGEFWTAHYHADCRAAEEYFNFVVRGGYDEWDALHVLEPKEVASIRDLFPTVALRLRPELVKV